MELLFFLTNDILPRLLSVLLQQHAHQEGHLLHGIDLHQPAEIALVAAECLGVLVGAGVVAKVVAAA